MPIGPDPEVRIYMDSQAGCWTERERDIGRLGKKTSVEETYEWTYENDQVWRSVSHVNIYQRAYTKVEATINQVNKMTRYAAASLCIGHTYADTAGSFTK